MRRARPKAVAGACSLTNHGSGRRKKLQRRYSSFQDTIRLHKFREIETRSSPDSLAAAHRGFTFYVADPISSIATEQTRRRVIPTDELICCRSKFGFQENHFGASWSRRGFHAVADRRLCSECDL